ncbi:MAG: NADH:flavin oxidoreductase [Clostridiaceae bacterium]|nr:NADH:flavin oxidoreductase [Clostridiaceae bacterium]
MTYLNKPLQIGNLTLFNRLIMPPMATSKGQEDGKISKAVLEYYNEKSKGGDISLIIIEHSFINQQGKASNQQLSVAEDSVVEGLSELADIVHNNGSKVVMQINHAGSAAKNEVTGLEVVGPSAIFNPRLGSVPIELNDVGIKHIIKSFKDAAVRVKAAGFDGVEIHSAHGYLLNQFFSPLTNKRQDQYGGDVHNRIRIHLEIIKEVREAVGEDFLILLRLGASDYMEGGTTIEDSKIAVKEFEKAGVAILDISGGFNGFTVPGFVGKAYFESLTEAIKEVVSIPVILTGGITEVQVAEELLMEGKADLIGVGRSIYNDSTWAKKAIESFR